MAEQSKNSKKQLKKAEQAALSEEMLKQRTVDVYERIVEEIDGHQSVRVSWPDKKVPPVRLRQANKLSPEELGAWPKPRPPFFTKPLRPRTATGPRREVKSSLPVMVIGAFGLNDEKMETVVQQFFAQHDPRNNFLVCFTDTTNQSLLRDYGINFEYFPNAIYGNRNRTELFREKFLQAWRRWGGTFLVDCGEPGFLRKRIDELDEFISPPEEIIGSWDPRTERRTPPDPVPIDVASLKAEYLMKGLDEVSDTFVLYRILGNDLPPRHKSGQTLSNLRFMLEHEPELEYCEKRWIVNRIIEPEQEAKVISLLKEYDQPYLRIPFDLAEYQEVEWQLEGFPSKDFFLSGKYWEMSEYDQLRAEAHARRNKNRYAIHNNGARNAALRDGRERAKWVLPWDGNCFLTKRAWQEIVAGVKAEPFFKYFIVPMSRTLDNTNLLDDDYHPEATEEPQILFRSDSQEEFDEMFCYGRRPKVELFYRLGVPGPWNTWQDDRWDLPQPDLANEAGTFTFAGWVARLFSGEQKLETGDKMSMRSRGVARIEAVNSLLDNLDREAAEAAGDFSGLGIYDEDKIGSLGSSKAGSPERAIYDRLLVEAGLAMQRGLYSVTDKTELPPSGDPHDYYHPAPYWWPNPDTPTGVPYIFKDGQRIPGTRLYEPESDKYDRTRLQRLFDDTTVLALAWKANGDPNFASKAAKLIKCWFIDDSTKMNPNLNFAQHKALSMFKWSVSFGAIEMKDVYFFLDAVRLVARSGALSRSEIEKLRSWWREYIDWLLTAEQFQNERVSTNNHGTCFDLQVAAIAAYLGDISLLQETFRTSRGRMLAQFWKGGKQPHELKRTQTQHYTCFNMQSWMNLATLAESFGDRLWLFEGSDGRGLAQSLGWLVNQMTKKEWPFEQIASFDKDRLFPIFFTAWDRSQDNSHNRLIIKEKIKPIFHPHDGVPPFWMLTKAPRTLGHSDSWQKLSTVISERESDVADLWRGTGKAIGKPLSPSELEQRLWYGFCSDALAGLDAINKDPKSSPTRLAAVARVLARWHLFHENFSEALGNLNLIVPSNQAEEREFDLLTGYCLARSGDKAGARAIAARALDHLPDDTCFLMLLASLEQEFAGEAGISALASNKWLNEVYQSRNLRPLNSNASSHNKPHPEAGGEERKVSVLISIRNMDETSRASVESIARQSVSDLQILLITETEPDEAKSFFKEAVAGRTDVEILQASVNASTADRYRLAQAKVTGTYIATQDSREIAHPQRLELQIDTLARTDWSAGLTSRALVSENGSYVGDWSDGFTLVPESPYGVMVRHEVLLEVGGWDSGTEFPEQCLVWRVRKSFGNDTVGHVMGGVPLTFKIGAPDNTGQPAWVPSDLGADQDIAGLQRAVARRKDEAETAPSDENVDGTGFSIYAPVEFLQPKKRDMKNLFVGDFRTSALGIESLLELLKLHARKHGSISLLDWPDFLKSPKSELHEGVLQLFDEGLVMKVEEADIAKFETIILCSPQVITFRINRVKLLAPKQVKVMCASPASMYDGLGRRRRKLPTTDEMESIFGVKCEWVPV